MPVKKQVTVRILDQNFMINTDASPERVEEVADFLNDSLRQIMSKSKTPSPFHAAVLAALNMTEKYFDAVDKRRELKTKVAEKSKKILRHLDAGEKQI